MSLKNVRKLLNETNDIGPLGTGGIDDEADLDDCSIQGPVIGKSRKQKKAGLRSLVLLVEDDEEVDDGSREEENCFGDNRSDSDDNLNAKLQSKKNVNKKKRKPIAVDSDVSEEEDDIDIEKTVEEVNRILGPVSNGTPCQGNNVSKSIDSLLRVVNRNLNFGEEYRSIKSAQELSLAMTVPIRPVLQSTSESSSIRDPRTGRMRLQANNRRTNLAPKNWLLVNPSRHESIPNLGLSMELDTRDYREKSPKKSSKVFNFAICHNLAYQRVHVLFMELIKRNDTEGVIKVMNENPNHVESLINAASLIAREDSNLSFELIQRALLLYQNVFPLKFNPSANICRINYKKPENRPFFVALFKFMVQLEKFACFKTALEVSKLLLSLDTSDPLFILLVIDHYAIQSKNYDFLIDFFGQKSLNLDKLPNFLFNTALALLMKSLDKAPKVTEDGQLKVSKVSKLSQLERQSLFNQANEILQEGLLLFPSILRPLLDTMGVETDAAIKKCPYFAVDTMVTYPADQSPLMHDLIELFIERNAALWKSSSDCILWLETNVNLIIQRLQSDPSIVSKYQSLRYKYYPVNSITPKNIFRHVYLSGMRKVKIPKDVLVTSDQTSRTSTMVSDQILPFDPIPPIDTLEYETSVVIQETSGDTGAIGGILSSFVKSWLPSFNAVDQGKVSNTVVVVTREPVNGQRGEDSVEAGTTVIDDNSSVTSVVTAVKDILSGFSVGEENEEEED